MDALDWKARHGQERYYLDKVAEGAEDYYSGEGEAEGQWLGDAAAELGLEGEVEPDQLIAMLTGRNPATASRWDCAPSPVAARSPASISPSRLPKSVSLLWALGGPEASAEVTAAHRALRRSRPRLPAARGVLDPARRRRREFVKGNGFLAAAYLHRSSRAGDPQLHTHALIANATQGTGRPLDPPLPPGDLRPRQDRRLHL